MSLTIGTQMAQVAKNLPAKAGDSGFIPGSERAPGGGNGNRLQYSCLGNLMGRGAWWATVHGVHKELDTTEQLTTHAFNQLLKTRAFSLWIQIPPVLTLIRQF